MYLQVSILARVICLLMVLIATSEHLTAQNAPPAPAAETAVDNPFIWKERGETAYAGRDFAAAAQFFGRYFNEAYHQDILMDALQPLMRSLIYSGELAEAEKVLAAVPRRMGEIVPANAPAEQRQLTPLHQNIYLYWQARVEFLQGKTESALGKFVRAAEAPSPEALRTRANYGAAEAFVARENWAEAETRFKQLAEQHLSSEEQQRALVGLIRALVMQKKYDDADKLSGEQWDNATGVYRTQIGMLYIASLLARDYVEQAYAIYKDAFVREVDYLSVPSHFNIIRALGRALIDKAGAENAVLVFERMLPLVTQEDQKKTIILDLADALSAAGQRAAAIRHLKTFIQLYPQDERLRSLTFRIAQLYERLTNFTEAITWYEQVYNEEAAPIELRHRSARRIAWISRENQQNYARAIHYFEAAARLTVPAEEQAHSLFLAAETRALIEDFNSAANQYGRVADTYPETTFASEARYKQGIALYSSKQYASAAEAFAKFIEKWPEHAQAADAMLKQGLSQRHADLNDGARQTLEAFAKKYPDSTEVPYALLLASEAASANRLPDEAIRLLTRIINDFPHSQHFPFALYRRAYQNLTKGRHDQAISDSVRFLERYSKTMPDLAPDVLLWLGDHYAGSGMHKDAERYFKTVVRDFPDSVDAPVALYESARNAFRVGNYDQAVADLSMLQENYPDTPPRVKAQALFVRADIATLTGDYKLASELLTEAVGLVPRTRLHYAALGRLGESHYNIGNALERPADAEPHYRKSIELFSRIIQELENGNTEGRDSLVEKARYRKARVHEKLNEIREARAEYNYIFWSYKNAEIEGERIFDWYYFARAGFDLARLYFDEGQYSSAIAIYRRLANSRIPIASDAQSRARELSRLYQVPSADTPAPAPTP